jgi:Site-specific recombinase XerD
MNRKREKETGFVRVGECLYRQTHNGKYYFKGQIGGREFTRSLKTTDRAYAVRLAAEFRRSREHLDPTADRTTLAALCELYRPRFAHLKEHTRETKERILTRIKHHWPTGANTTLNKIRPSECEQWLASVTENRSASTRNDHVWLLKDMFGLAVDDRLLVSSPAAKLKAIRREDPERLTPTFGQFEEIIRSVRSQKFNGHGSEDSADFLEFMGLAGLGQAEASALTRGDVHWESEQIAVLRRKTSKRFFIPIYPQVRPLLEKLCQEKAHHEKLFALSDGKKALAGACRRLNLPPFSQRSLRRMFITRAIERGVDVKVIAEWQGHRDGSLILSTYSHVRPIHSQRMARLMTTAEPENVVPMPKQGKTS